MESFLEKRMKDGLYLLQFRKCEDDTCCQRLVPDLPPYLHAPILKPKDEHYAKFQDLYGKVEVTERYFLCHMVNEITFQKQEGFKYISS